MRVLEKLNPNKVFYYFEEISQIPRGSGNEKAISDYIVEFAKDRGLFVYQDSAYNVVIKKAGTKGYEDSQAVVLQGHIDMVCEKNNDVSHDFTKDPLKLKVEGDFVTADGTTLGADDGIAVAYMLALLDEDGIKHPPLECLFTTDEEAGMKGAIQFDGSVLTGKRLINLDTEEEGKLLVSCCGGMKVTTQININYEEVSSELMPLFIKIRGLKGGHSGSDIHLQRANANKLMGRVLKAISEVSVKVSKVNGGLMDNAISRECDALIFVEGHKVEGLKAIVDNMKANFIHEYKGVEDSIDILVEDVCGDIKYIAFDEITRKAVVDMLILIPYGVKTMSVDIEGLVESSNNIGVLRTMEDTVDFICAVRSSVASRKQLIFDEIETIGNLVNGKTFATSSYPGWEFNLLQKEFLENSTKKSLLWRLYTQVLSVVFLLKK